jgi:Domain of unknown function (DUF4136)
MFSTEPLWSAIPVQPETNSPSPQCQRGDGERTPVGTLHIDMFDSQSKKVIWHGVCTDTLTGSPEKNEKKMEKSVADVFKKFPPPEKG